MLLLLIVDGTMMDDEPEAPMNCRVGIDNNKTDKAVS
jgi:hypothetical protein